MDGEVVIKILGDDADFRAKVSKLGTTTEKAITRAGTAMASAGSLLSKAVTLPLAAGSIAAAKFGIDSANAAEKAEIAFTTMLKSEEKAHAMMKQIADLAKKGPFEVENLTLAAQKMLAYGFAAQDVIPLLKSIGDATAALGMGADGVDRVALALGQIKAKGKLAGEEMRQLTEAGIPAWEMLSEALGISIPEAMKKTSQGAISADEAIKALQKGLDKRFGGMAEKQAYTLAGALSNIKDAAQSASAQIYKTEGYKEFVKALVKLGDAMGPFIDKLMPSFSDGLMRAARAISKLDVNNLMRLFNALKMMAALGPALLITGKSMQSAGAALGIMNGATNKFAGVMSLAIGKLSTIGSMAEKLPGKLAGPIGFVSEKLSSLPSIVGKIAGGFATIAPAAMGVVNVFTALSGAVALVSLALMGATTAIATTGGSVSDMLSGVAPAVQDFGSVVAGAISGFANAIPAAAAGIAAQAPAILEALTTVTDSIMLAISDTAVKIAANMPAFIDPVVQGIATMAPAILEAGILLFAVLLEALAQTITSLAEQAPTIATNFADVISQSAPTLLTAATNFFDAIVQALPVILPLAIEGLLNGILNLISLVIDNAPAILAAAVSFFTQIVVGIIQILPQVLSGIANLIGQLIAKFPQSISTLLGAALGMFIAIVQAIVQTVPKVLRAIGDMLKSAFHAVTSYDFSSAGKAIIDGLVAGVKSVAGNIVKAVTGAVGGAIDAAKKLLGIHSPSRVFRKFGVYTGEGYVLGVRSEQANVRRAMTNLMGEVVEAGNVDTSLGINAVANTSSGVAANSKSVAYSIGKVELKADKLQDLTTVEEFFDQVMRQVQMA